MVMLGGLNTWDCYCAFMGHFFLTFALSLLQASVGPMWISIAGFFVVFLNRHYNGFDFGNARAFASFFKGLTGGEGLSLIDYLITTGLQFGGGCVGSLLFILIAGVPSGPMAGAVWALGGNIGRILVFFLFANMANAGCFYATGNGNATLYDSLTIAVGYMMTWSMAQYSFANSVGGFTIDFARMLMSMIFEGDAYKTLVKYEDGVANGSVGSQMDLSWVLIVGAFGGMLAGCGVTMIEGKLRGGDDKAADAPAADENA